MCDFRLVAKILGLGPGPVCTGSTTTVVLAEGTARVPVL